MSDHDLAIFAGGQPLLVLLVEGGQFVGEVGEVVPVAFGALGVDLAHTFGQGFCGLGHEVQVQPEVGVVASVVVLVVVVGGRAQLHDLADVERVVGGLLCDGFVDGRLESLDVEGDVGLTDLADLSAGQLQVVRLRSGLGELNDRDLVTTDLLGQPLEGVDTGDHGEVRIGGGDARVVRCVTVVCAGRE